MEKRFLPIIKWDAFPKRTMSSAMASESSNARTNSGKKMSDCAFSRAHMALADRPTFVPIFQNRAMECQALYLDLVRGSPVNRGMRVGICRNRAIE
ncbi:hypothetical protein V6N13_088512 [Hibiscus sabdariffa]